MSSCDSVVSAWFENVLMINERKGDKRMALELQVCSRLDVVLWLLYSLAPDRINEK